ncbi:hypothetical protein V8D89_014883 [Ganoderma adspersum]
MKVSTRFAGLAATAGIFLLLVLKISLKVATAVVSGHHYNTALDELKNVNPPLFDVGDRKEVLLLVDSWKHYSLDSAEQWAPLFPNGGVVHLGPDNTTYTVGMMHQLRCLDAIRAQLARPSAEREEQPTRHCLNYLRQVLMCRDEGLKLDPFQYAHKVMSLSKHPIRRCKDWRPVYEKVWENQGRRMLPS